MRKIRIYLSNYLKIKTLIKPRKLKFKIIQNYEKINKNNFGHSFYS